MSLRGAVAVATVHAALAASNVTVDAVTAPTVEELTRSLHLAAAAYCPQDAVESWSCGLHCDPISDVSVHRFFHVVATWPHNFQGYVGFDSANDVFVVSLKGTDSSNVRNWVSNLDFLKTYPFSQYPKMGLHSGFWKAWTSVKSLVLKALDELEAKHGSKPLHMVGHSLGGAMATNGALDLAVNHQFSAGLHTFGSPRLGDPAYAQAVSERLRYVFRVTHSNDLVVHLPQRSLGFHHTPWEVHFFAEGLRHKLCDGSGEDSTCANACGWHLNCGSLADHMHYLELPATCGMPELENNSVLV